MTSSLQKWRVLWFECIQPSFNLVEFVVGKDLPPAKDVVVNRRVVTEVLQFLNLHPEVFHVCL